MARGFVRIDADTTPDAETLRSVIFRAREIENNFAVKIANAIRGVNP